jgi:hypothetical protein
VALPSVASVVVESCKADSVMRKEVWRSYYKILAYILDILRVEVHIKVWAGYKEVTDTHSDEANDI